MQHLLKEKLRSYIQQNNPELLIGLQESFSVNTYLDDQISKVMPTVVRLLGEEKPGYIIEELAMNELTEPLRPSRFNYLQDVLEEEFNKEYHAFKQAGVLTYETINLIEACKDTFENFPFTEDTEDVRFLRYAIIAKVHDYLN
jgi:hypothetical protein